MTNDKVAEVLAEERQKQRDAGDKTEE